jgi:hypothetical protein
VRRLLSTATRFSVVLTRLAYLVWQWQSIIDGEHTAIQPAKILRLHLVRRLWKFKWYRPNFFIRYRLFRSRHDNNKSQRIGKQDRAKSFPLEYRTPPIPQLALPSVATQTTKDKSRLRNLYGEAPDQKYAAESAMRHLGLESIARRLTGKLASGFVRTALREKGKPFRQVNRSGADTDAKAANQNRGALFARKRRSHPVCTASGCPWTEIEVDVPVVGVKFTTSLGFSGR